MQLTVNRMWICGKRRALTNRTPLSESITCDLRVNHTWFSELNYGSDRLPLDDSIRLILIWCLSQVAIGAIGKLQKLPRYDEDGAVVPQTIFNISWSGDHRVIDGVHAPCLTMNMQCNIRLAQFEGKFGGCRFHNSTFRQSVESICWGPRIDDASHEMNGADNQSESLNH